MARERRNERGMKGERREEKPLRTHRL